MLFVPRLSQRSNGSSSTTTPTTMGLSSARATTTATMPNFVSAVCLMRAAMLLFMGAFGGIVMYATIRRTHCSTAADSSAASEVRRIASLWKWPGGGKNIPGEATVAASLSSSWLAITTGGSSSAHTVDESSTIPPFYQEDIALFEDLPPEYSKTFYNECGKNCHPFIRALRSLGWQKVNSLEKGRLILTFATINPEWLAEDSPLESWQRYAHLPTTYSWAHDVSAFYELVKDRSTYLPATYRLDDEEDRELLDKTLNHSKKDTGVKTHPWVLQPYEDGARPTLVPPKPKLSKDLPEQGALLSKYVCHSMGWGPSKQKFDVRVFFFVVTLDPLVVVYHDGHVQTSSGPYREGSYDSDTDEDVHLMNYGEFKHDSSKHSFDALEEMLNANIYNTRRRRRPKILRSSKNNIDTPMQHVRNQMKEAVAQVVHALSPTAFSMEDNHDRDGWELFAADFVIDEDLDVWLISAHDDIALHEDVYSNLELGHDMYTGMIRILEEVWTKQEQAAKDGAAPVPILPLETPSKFELLYVSDVDKNRNYMYNYAEYDRRKSLRKKKECAKVRKN
uniref:Tubulin--tyrosine ligase n=1 Tax=Grammatophora oceanica TaxID=210454 RepID=A0A7S1VHN4_9STRA|mmetsp:Transcript_45443/g.67494  ORF Transcript_45443/g.67494 Transcript_45443/m.67494 type:complete len:563 (+) Transcript_45443:95-1783(+)